MTVVNLGNGMMQGLAADTKPTRPPTGTRFFETDTGLEYYWNGTAWTSLATGTFLNQTLKFRNPANTFTGTVQNPILTADKNIGYGYPSFGNYIAYRDGGGNYIAKNLRTNAIDYSGAVSASPETAIQTAITNAGSYGTVFINGQDTFTVTSTFTGFNLLYRQEIIMGQGARISVPTGFANSVFNLYESNGCQQCRIYGGMIQELTTPSRLWTAFDFQSTTTAGMWANEIHGTRVYSAGKALALRTDTNGWTNGNIFDGLFADQCGVGVSFEHTGVFTAFLSGANQNMFSSNIIQAGTGTITTNGYKDVNGRRNMFLNDYTADFSGAASTCNITVNAADTIILGGSTTALNFTDLSPSTTPTVIRDAYQGDVAYRRKSLLYEDGVAISVPSSPSTGTVRRYTKTIDANNDGRFYKKRLNGAVVEVEI